MKENTALACQIILLTVMTSLNNYLNGGLQYYAIQLFGKYKFLQYKVEIS